jgi:tetratricopeptide (TPR) repeat protein
MHRILILLFFIASQIAYGQTKAEKLFQTKQWAQLVEMKPQAKKLSGRDIYRIGQGCMKEGQDTAAIRMFRMAIKKGYKTGDLYYNLGICYNQVEMYSEAIKALDNALYLVPDRKIYLLEKGASWYSMGELDSALATYKYVQKGYPKNQFSAYMVCLVLHEQERLRSCLDCYYNSLYKFKDHNKFYRKSLESIVRLEWNTYARYDKAEKAIKNLMHAYPKNYEYNIWLVQLYHEQGLYEKANPLIVGINTAYDNRDLGNSYYKKGHFLIDAYESNNYFIETYQWFRPKKVNKTYTLFLFSKVSHGPKGKLEVRKTEDGFMIIDIKTGNSLEVLEELKYQNVKNSVAEFFQKQSAEPAIDSNNVRVENEKN